MLRHLLLTQGMSLGGYLGYPVAKAVKLLHHSEYWSSQEMAMHRNQALSALIQHCFDHVPYYRDLMKQRGLSPSDFHTVHDLAKLPYLTRDIIREQGERLRADNYPDNACQFRRSGGTTGEPIEVAADVQARAFEVAAYLRGFEWMKYKPGQPMVRLFGGSLGLRQSSSVKASVREWLLNNRFLPAFELTPENVPRYVDVMQQAEGGILVGYASAVRNLAEYMSNKGLRVDCLESIVCTAEYMPQEWRSYISEVLGAPVFCYYGCGEIHSIAYECSGEEGYIVSDEHIVLEVESADAERFTPEGKGQACVTALFNYAMPLIRYLNGDLLRLQYVNAKRPHLRIVELEGRIVDQLIRTDGYKISGAFIPHLVYKSGFPAWKYQVIQKTPNYLVFHYLPQHKNNSVESKKEQVVEIFREHLGANLRVEFVEDAFEVSRSGKHRFVISEIANSYAS